MSTQKSQIQSGIKSAENNSNRQSRDSKLKALINKRKKDRLAANKQPRTQWEKNAQIYEAEYKALDKSLVDNMRKAKVEGGFYVPAEAKLMLVIRIREYQS